MKKYIIGILLVLLCFAITGCDDKKEKAPDVIVTPDIKLSGELQDTVEFVIKDDKQLMAVQKDGKEIVVFDLDNTKITNGTKTLTSNYKEFYYYYDNSEGIVYLSSNDK